MRVAPMIFRIRLSMGEDAFGKSSGLLRQQEDRVVRSGNGSWLNGQTTNTTRPSVQNSSRCYATPTILRTSRTRSQERFPQNHRCHLGLVPPAHHVPTHAHDERAHGTRLYRNRASPELRLQNSVSPAPLVRCSRDLGRPKCERRPPNVRHTTSVLAIPSAENYLGQDGLLAQKVD
jgi:hypothetical protein